MRVYRHPSKNEYLRTEDGLWVRNLCKEGVVPLNINDVNSDHDRRLFLENETANRKRGQVYLDPAMRMEKVVIVSDGHDFERRHRVLARLPKDVHVLAVNGALAKWRLMEAGLPAAEQRRINHYVVNNPYPQCLKFLPRSGYWPKCVASSRTFSGFVKECGGDMTFYTPPDEENFTGQWSRSAHCLDDYRSPVCAAISFAYHCRASRIVLLCCDDSYEVERPGMQRLENGLWTYPQQVAAQRAVHLMLRWMSEHATVRLGDCSSGLKCEVAAYIDVEDVPAFLDE